MASSPLLVCLGVLAVVSGCSAEFARHPRFKGPVVNDPKAQAAASVVLGHGRFTLLTSRLVRMEFSNSGAFDDRPTVQVVNRNLPVPEYTVKNLSSNSIQISTDTFQLTYTDLAGPANKSCGNEQTNTDQSGGSRVPNYPNGATVSNVAGCCALCDADAVCSAFVYATDNESPNCWLMEGVTGTVPANNRIFGGQLQGGFSAKNLQIEATINGQQVTWTPGMQQQANLLGTYDALDCYSTPGECYEQSWQRISPGLLSRDGWNLLDDSGSARFVPNGNASDPLNWTWWDSTPVDVNDWYFFAYGNDYTTTLADFALVGGAITLPPRSAFGIWWSRYWAYSAQTIVSEVLSGYANYSIPLNHLVLDMDWHNEPSDPSCSSWGNFDWNLNLFPDPQGFISWVHSSNNILGRSLKLLLNVHPQSGVDHCMLRYPQIASVMGVNPASNQTVPCDMFNKLFSETLYSVYYDAQPLAGVDYWWTDYGGCGNGPNPLLWSNYVYDSHMQIARQRRPLVLSRNGGLGNQRYPIGFSGDTFQHELLLDFEIETTPMAANVLFGYWSHDVGGFHNGQGCPGDSDPSNYTGSELFLRWVQFGSVAPIMRTHCDHCERRIFMFPYHFQQLRDAFYLRDAFAPYIYTNARKAYDTGIALIHPLYYDEPDQPEAYNYSHQYKFGDAIIAAPISSMVDPSTNLTSKAVWLPSGQWFKWDGSATYTGPTVVTDTYNVSEIPLYVQQGSILALKNISMQNVQTTSPDMLWTLFPGAAPCSTTTIYEDDGDSLDYLNGVFATTTASYTYDPSAQQLKFIVDPVEGSYVGMPSSRQQSLVLRGFPLPSVVSVNGYFIPQGYGTPGWYVNTEYSLTSPIGSIVINCGSFSLSHQVTVLVDFSS